MPLRLAAALFALVGLVPLPAFAQNLSAAGATATTYLQRNAARHGVSAADVAELVVTDAVPLRAPGASAVYLRQAVGGIPVVAGQMTVSVLADGRVLHAAGRLVPGLSARVRAGASASVDAARAADAVARAVEPQTGLRSAGFSVVENARAGARVTLTDGGIARLPAQAQLVWADATPETAGDALVLAWETTLYLPGEAGDWYGLVDAATGAVLRTEDRLVREAAGFEHFHGRSELPAAVEVAVAPVVAARATARHEGHVAATHSGSPFIDIVDALTSPAGGATYRVYAYPVESPNHTTPAPPADARTVEVDPHDAAASPLGWHDDNNAAGAEYTDTRGNNTWSYLDANDDDTWASGDSPDCGASLACDFPINLAAAPNTYVPAAVANLFYWNNIIHDIFWHYGFDEASGNFRQNNYGRGGAGNDPVNAEAQDGSGTNNANFSTPPDGSRPRMQMYRGTNVTPNRDGDLDNPVIAHEYGHGISIRLTGGPSQVDCLRNAEQMGEGWSDYFGLILSMRPTDTADQARGIGTYLFGQPATGAGIRPSPYSRSFTVNSYTYQDTRSLVAPHGVGFAWATVLWDITWDLVDAHGFDADIWNASGTAGNQIALQLVVEGLKLQPCSPGFVDGRNAILAADQALYGGAHTDLLWAAFARRGLGIGASQGSSGSNSDNTEDFAEPETIAPSAVTDLAATPNGDFVMLAFTATGDDGTVGTASGYDVRYSTTPITDDATFNAATQMTGEPLPQAAGTAESFMLPGLTFNQAYYVAMKVSDNSFNTSDLSNVVQVTTLSAPVASYPATEVEAAVLEVGQTTTEDFVINNTGPSDLRYSVTLAEATRRGTPIQPEVGPAGPEEVKDAPQTPGTSAERGRGGPDDFGYSWIDSNEPGGPAFSWVDIAATGTAVSLGDDASVSVPLPFAFPYYGTDRTSVRIVSNGWLGFAGSGTSNAYTNAPIPTSDAPNDFIAGFWDDLNPSDGGSIRYQNMGDGRFVVSWLAVPHYSNGGVFTFQIVLYQDGRIRTQYQTMSGDVTSATVGIEDPVGTDGLQVVFNSAYVQNNLAVEFSTAPAWLTVAPASGTVAVGASETLTFTMDAAELEAGVYQEVVGLAHNDPTKPMPLRMHVVFAVGGAFAPPALATPLYGSTVASPAVLSWLSAPGAAGTEWQVSTSPTFATIAASGSGAGTSTTVALDPSTGYYWRARSTGSGAPSEWSLPFAFGTSAIVADAPSPTAPTLALGAVYPNPTTGALTIPFALSAADAVRVRVLDVTGRAVAVLADDMAFAAGEHRLMWDAAGLPSGVYLVELRAAGTVRTTRVTVLH